MDQLKGAFNSFAGGNKNNTTASNNQAQQQGNIQQQGGSGSGGSGGGFLDGLGDKFNSAAGGGRESEKNEDYLDKGECGLPIYSSIMRQQAQSRIPP